MSTPTEQDFDRLREARGLMQDVMESGRLEGAAFDDLCTVICGVNNVLSSLPKPSQ